MKKTWLIAAVVTLLVGLTVLVGAGSLLQWTAVRPVQKVVASSGDYVADGKQALYDHNILLAKEKFLAAVAADPANPEAQFFLGITRIAAIYEDGQSLNTPALDSLKEILTKCGATFTSFNLYNTQATFPQQLPATAPASGAVLDFVAVKVIPELDAALQNFGYVTSTGFSSTLQPPALAKTGNEYTIDYADVLTIKTFVYAAKATLELLLAYNWDVQNIPDIITAKPKDLQDFHKLLVDHPNFATPKEPARLTAAKWALIDFIDTFNLANDYIGLRSGQTGHLFVLDAPITNELAAVAAAKLAEFKTALSDIKASLSGPTVYSFIKADNDNQRTVDLSKAFDSSIPVNIRNKVIDLSSNTILPDRTFGNIMPFGVTSPGLEQKVDAAAWELTWKLVTDRRGLLDVASNGTTYVAVGYNMSFDAQGQYVISGIISTSPDGLTWTSQDSIPGYALYKVKWVGNLFVALSYSNSSYLTSPDGVNWTQSNISNSIMDIAWGNNTFVRVGNVIETSPDGVNWTQRSVGGDGGFISCVTWAGDRFVAGRNGYQTWDGYQWVYHAGSVLTSPDGQVWTNSDISISETLTNVFGVSWSGSKIVATGAGKNQSTGMLEPLIITSTDGAVWTKQTLDFGSTSGFMVFWSRISWGGGQFMIVSGDNMLTSPDGVNWTVQRFMSSNNFTGVTFGNNRFTVVTGKGIYTQTGAPASEAGSATGVTLTPSVASPQTVGTTVTLTAQGAGGSGSYEYQFYTLAPGGTWAIVQPYSTTSTYSWNTAGMKPGAYQLAVWAKTAGTSPAAGNDASAFASYTLNPLPVTTNVTLTPSVTSPQTVGTNVTLTAQGAGGTGNYEYQFYTLAPGGTWTIVRPYSATSTYSWNTAGKAAGVYQLAVWAKTAGTSPAAGNDAFVISSYTLIPPGVTTGVTLTPSVTSPQTVGTTVTLTAQGAGGTGNYEYQFYTLAPGGTWTIVRPYSATSTYSWNTAGKAAGVYQLAVWAKTAGTSPVTGNDASAFASYTLNPLPVTTNVTLTPSVATPQNVGTTITLTAQGTGGTGNYEYQFYTLAPGGTWTIVQPYSTTSTYSWNTAGKAAGVYQLAVWAKTAGTAPAAGNDALVITSYTLIPAGAATGVTLTPSVASPQTVGTTVTLTAQGAGGSGSYEYQFYTLAPGGTWAIVQPYSTTSTYSWNTAGMKPGAYQLAVWAKTAGTSPAAGNDASAFASYTLNPLPVTTNVTLTPSVTSPQTVGTNVTLTAQGAGGTGNYEYQFYTLAPGGTWTIVRPYSATSTYSWNTAGKAAGVYQLAVWAKTAGTSPAAGNDAFVISSYTLIPPGVTTGVTLTPSVTSPQTVGTTVTLTAQGAGGTGNYEYQFYTLAPGGTWTIVRPYSATSTYSWNTAGKAAGVYQLAVWAKTAGTSPVTGNDASAFASYTLNPLPVTTNVTLTPSVATPQNVGTTITLTAQGTGGTGNYEYQFYTLAPGGTWTIVQPYSTTSTYSWNTAGKAAGVYQLAVWAKTAGTAPAAGNDALVITSYTLIPAGAATGVTLTPSVASPQNVGTTVTLTAQGAGGTGNYEYQFYTLAPGGLWTVVRPYSTTSTYNWNTAGKAAGAYQLAVWVKAAGTSPAAGNDAYVINNFALQ